MDALTRAMERSRGVALEAFDRGMRTKQTGFVSDQITAGAGMNLFGQTQEQARYQQQFGLNRGWLYAAVNQLALDASKQPVRVARLTKAAGEGKRGRVPSVKAFHERKMTATPRIKAAGKEMEILEDHELAGVLDSPNPAQHRQQLVSDFVSNLCFTGWGFLVGGEAEGGGMELFCLPSTWVRVDHSKGLFAQFYVADPKNPSAANDKPLGRENVMVARLSNPADPRQSLAPVATQVEAVRIDDYIQRSREGFFRRGVFPSVIVTVGKTPHPDVPGGLRPRLTGVQRRQLFSAIMKSMADVENAGYPAIVDGMIDSIVPFSWSQREMGWEKSEKQTKERILSALGVHEFILGSSLNVGGYAQAAIIQERFCERVNVYLDMLSTAVTEFARSFYGDDELLVWWEKAEPHDPQLYWENMKFARQNSDIDVNEFRAALGFPPVKGEQKTKSKMLESVGGMTGAVQIMTAVGQGMMQADTAARLFALFFDLPLSRAQQIVGVPSEREVLESAAGALREAVAELRITPRQLACRIAEECE